MSILHHPLHISRPDLHLARVMQILFAHQAREVLSRLTLRDVIAGKKVDLSHWLGGMVTALKPTVLQQWQIGMSTMGQQITQSLLQQGRPVILAKKSWRGQTIAKAANPVRLDFDLTNPRVLDAVDAATMRFCRETNATATDALDKALAELREQLKEGLSHGEAVVDLAKRVRTIFADPARAYRIAVTEASRALHAGQIHSAKESGMVSGKRWIASSDACPQCLSLGEKDEVPLDDPFIVLPSGGIYATIMHPPAHPHCACSMGAVLAPTKEVTPVPIPVPFVPKGPALGLNQTAGTHSATPWEPTILEVKAQTMDLQNDPDAKVKVKQVVDFTNPHEKELKAAAKELKKVRTKLESIQDKINKLPFTDDYNRKKDKLLKDKQSAGNDFDLYYDQKEKAQEVWMQDHSKHLVSIFKVPDPVPVQPQYVGHFPRKVRSHIQSVCALLSQIAQRSSYGESSVDIPFRMIPAWQDQRAYHDQGEVWLSNLSDQGTIIHEVGHALEYLYPKAAEAVRAFWQKRCGQEIPTNLRSKFGSHYASWEEGHGDDFAKVWGKVSAFYVGKKYVGGQTEILSMGLQCLLENPRKLARNDPEYFALLCGILRGDYR